MTPGYEVPLAAAFGAAADALAVTSPSAAADAIRLLRKQDAGRAALLLAGVPEDTGTAADLRGWGSIHARLSRGARQAAADPQQPGKPTRQILSAVPRTSCRPSAASCAASS